MAGHPGPWPRLLVAQAGEGEPFELSSPFSFQHVPGDDRPIASNFTPSQLFPKLSRPAPTRTSFPAPCLNPTMTATTVSRPSPSPSASPSSSSSSSTPQSATTQASSPNSPSALEATPGISEPQKTPPAPIQTDAGGRSAKNQGYGTFGSPRGTPALARRVRARTRTRAVRLMARKTLNGGDFSSVVLIHSILLLAHPAFSGYPAIICGQDFGRKRCLAPGEAQ